MRNNRGPVYDSRGWPRRPASVWLFTPKLCHGHTGLPIIMLPLLRFAADDKEHSLREAIESLSREFELMEDEKKGSHRSCPMRRRKLTAIISSRGKTANTPGRWIPDKKERKASLYLS